MLPHFVRVRQSGLLSKFINLSLCFYLTQKLKEGKNNSISSCVSGFVLGHQKKVTACHVILPRVFYFCNKVKFMHLIKKKKVEFI